MVSSNRQVNYLLKSQSNRAVMAFETVALAEAAKQARAERGVTLRLVKQTVIEEEI